MISIHYIISLFKKRYELSYKLFFILNLFRHSSLSLGYVKEKIREYGYQYG